jgi:hypothetical protein
MRTIWTLPINRQAESPAVTEEDFREGCYVDAEIYQEWLEPADQPEVRKEEKREAMEDNHSHDHNHEKCCEEDHNHHQHDHDRDHSSSSPLPLSHKEEKKVEKRADDDHHHESHEHDHSHSHSHSHSHQDRDEVERTAHQREGDSDSPGKVVAVALVKLLCEKGVITNEQLMKVVQALENKGREMKGAELVARAWKDPIFKEKLLRNGKNNTFRFSFFSFKDIYSISAFSLFSLADSACGEVDIVASNPNTPTILRVVANTETIHNVIVCTLCSCYPMALLGLPPTWYKGRNYRARIVREPKEVLKEFGLLLPETVKIFVHDSTADCRSMVLPCPPKSLSEKDIQRMSIEELKALVTRDSMIGVAVL